MKKEDKFKSLKTVLYIVCFIAGTAIFLYMSNSIKIPVYGTGYGTVRISEGEAFIEIKDGIKSDSEKVFMDKIYYYINRDEWVEYQYNYDKSENCIKINNVHELKDGTKVWIDIQTGYMTLLEMILKGGNV